MFSEANFEQRCQQLLSELAGPTATLRDDQKEAIRALVVERRRVLVVQRTGWGKSAVYFLAAKLLREMGSGPTILVSPLLALMRDQLLNARRLGLVAETINSSNTDDWHEIEQQLSTNSVDLLAISPERLNNPRFVNEILGNLASKAGLVVIDEAHCISQWGHDFRPDYLRIRDALTHISADTPVLATTATATDWVIKDVATQIGATPLTLRGTLDRQSLELSVINLPTAAHRLAWLVENADKLSGSGIVYCLTQAMAEQTTQWLKSQDISAEVYTASVDTAKRETLEQQLRDNEIKMLCATSALGMGFDKPDLGFVINLASPSSITAYYQMVGRAGRALDHAHGILLPGKEDQRVWQWFDSVSFPPRHLTESVVAILDKADAPLTEAKIEALVDIKRTRLTSLLKVLDVEGAVKRVDGGWIRTQNEWNYNEDRYNHVRSARDNDQQQILAYQTTADCRMAFLRRSLDDPELTSDWKCNRCDRCTNQQVSMPAEHLVGVANDFTRDSPIILPARKMWPTGIAGKAARIKKEQQAVDGRALCQSSGLGWTTIVDELLLENADSIPGELITAIGRQLKIWTWPNGRPTWITYIPSTRRPNFTKQIATELGRRANLPFFDVITRTRESPPQSQMNNSAHAATNVGGAFSVQLQNTDIPDGPVLVFDDTWKSGWTMTVIAELLQTSGVEAVYPFAIKKE